VNIEMYQFPTLSDGRIAVEQKYCELLNKYRSDEKLQVEELDWMDSANTWLTFTSTKL